MISYDDFKKVEIRAGKILSADKIPDTDKLLKLMVDFAEKKERKNTSAQDVSGITSVVDGTVDGTIEMVAAPRQIISGISKYFPDPAVLVGKTCMFVTNLEPRMIKGFESNGMLFAVSTPEGAGVNGNSGGGFSLLEPNGSIPPGTLAA